MSALAIVLLVYIGIGMAKLSYVLYGRSAGKDIERHNARLFGQVRDAGSLAILIGIAAEILLWPYGIYLGYHVVRQMSLERRKGRARVEYRCSRNLSQAAEGMIRIGPPSLFQGLTECTRSEESPELARAAEEADLDDLRDALNKLEKNAQPGTDMGLSEETKKRIARQVQRELGPHDEGELL
jgi:hypothetical protein